MNLPYPLTYITGNPEKLRELKGLLGSFEHMSLELTEIQSLDNLEVAKVKLASAKEQIADADKRIIVIDDEGLVFENCGGLPGPLLKHFYHSLGYTKGLYAFAQAFHAKKVWAKIVVGVAYPGEPDAFFDASIEGNVVAQRGQYSNGYGSIFEIPALGKTYAELPNEVRDKIWLRALALSKVRDYLESKAECPPLAQS
jgi:inosine triphosphate pyrophosphatase